MDINLFMLLFTFLPFYFFTINNIDTFLGLADALALQVVILVGG